MKNDGFVRTGKAMFPYPLSRDYALLYRLAQINPIVCLVDYNADLRDIASTSKSGCAVRIGVLGYSYIEAETEDDFLKQCKAGNVEFVEPFGLISTQLPTKAGLYWWRTSPQSEWEAMDIKNYGSADEPWLSAYSVETKAVNGLSFGNWTKLHPIGSWIEIPKPQSL